MEEAPPPAQSLDVDICWLSARPLKPGARLLVKHTTRRERGVVDRIVYRRDVNSGEVRDAGELALNDLGRAHLRLAGPVFVRPYARSRTLGSLILIDEASAETVGAAMVL